jgi:hypothetical protein
MRDMTKRTTKYPMTQRNLILRINRKLKADDRQLKVARSGLAEQQVGRFYVVDVRGDYIVEKDVDLEEFARDIDVLKPWEQVQED